MPLISIIIPVYNMQKFLKECLDSVFSQSFKDFEVICIDDGSSDNSLEILNSYKQKDARIVIISKNNEGQGIARNKGLEIARGKYVMFVDSDDWLEPNALEKLYNKMEKDDCDVLLFCVYRVENKTGVKSQYPYAVKYLHGFENKVFEPKEVASSIFYIPAYPFKIYKKSILDKLNYRYEKGTFWEDHLPHFIVLSQSKRISILNEYIYNYRVHENSSTANAQKHADIIFENFLRCENVLKNYDNWEIFKPYFAARKIKVAFNYFDKINAEDRKKWYKNMRKLFCYINKNYRKEISQIDFNLSMFNKVCIMPFWVYQLYTKISKTIKVTLLYLGLNRL